MPYLLHRREANLFEAIATSVTAVRLNLRPMAPVGRPDRIAGRHRHGAGPARSGDRRLPVVGHATWHAYRDIVIFPDEAGA